MLIQTTAIDRKRPVRRADVLAPLQEYLFDQAMHFVPPAVSRGPFDDYLLDVHAHAGLAWSGSTLRVETTNPGNMCNLFEHAFTHWFEHELVRMAERPPRFLANANLEIVAPRAALELCRGTRPIVRHRDDLYYVDDPTRPFEDWTLVGNSRSFAVASLTKLFQAVVWVQTRRPFRIGRTTYAIADLTTRAEIRALYPWFTGTRGKGALWITTRQWTGRVDVTKLDAQAHAAVVEQLGAWQCNCTACTKYARPVSSRRTP